MSNTEEHTLHQEPDRIAWRTLAKIATIAALVIAAALVSSSAMLVAERGALRPHSERRPTHAPRQIGMVNQAPIDSERYGLRLRERQRERLANFGWVDRDAGIAHIPIELAMDLVARAAQSSSPGPDASAAMHSTPNESPP